MLIAQGTVDTKGCSPIYFPVPQTSRGKHTVTLKVGSKSWSRDFTVTGGITLDVSKGPVGTLITVQGCGFADQESNIIVTYDGNNVGKDVQANHDGSWTYKLKVPPSNRGGHPVSASGPHHFPDRKWAIRLSKSHRPLQLALLPAGWDAWSMCQDMALTMVNQV